MSAILLIVYLALGYWATGQTIFANKIYIGRLGELFIQRLALGALLGIVIIPVAIIKRFLYKQRRIIPDIHRTAEITYSKRTSW